jgi:hypothetical protein
MIRSHRDFSPSVHGDKVAKDVSRIIATDAVVIGIDFQDILRPGGIVLESEQANNETLGAAVNNEVGLTPPKDRPAPLERIGWSTQLTAGTGDQGVDVIATKENIR